jgi:hypothetical protein
MKTYCLRAVNEKRKQVVCRRHPLYGATISQPSGEGMMRVRLPTIREINRFLESRTAARLLFVTRLALVVCLAIVALGVANDFYSLGIPDDFWAVARGVVGGIVLIGAAAFLIGWCALSGWNFWQMWRGIRESVKADEVCKQPESLKGER